MTLRLLFYSKICLQINQLNKIYGTFTFQVNNLQSIYEDQEN